jgi:hypothetical protein
MKDWKKSDNFAKRFVSRNLMKGLDVTRNSSLDLRTGMSTLGKTYIGGKNSSGNRRFYTYEGGFWQRIFFFS